jgi:RNase P subunit RPR2
MSAGTGRVNSFPSVPERVKRRRATKEEVAALVKLLTESSVSLARTDMELAKKQAALARRVMLRFNLKLDPSLKRFTCRGCKSLLVPGVNARVRLGHGKPTTVRITCIGCGRVNRKILGQP